MPVMTLDRLLISSKASTQSGTQPLPSRMHTVVTDIALVPVDPADTAV